MQCVVAYGAAVPWAMQGRGKRRHVVCGFPRRTALADAREFVRDILSAFRCSDSSDPYSPFTQEAVDAALDSICSTGSTTPRQIMHAFRKITLDFIIDNPVGDTISATDVLKSLDDLGTDALPDEDPQG